VHEETNITVHSPRRRWIHGEGMENVGEGRVCRGRVTSQVLSTHLLNAFAGPVSSREIRLERFMSAVDASLAEARREVDDMVRTATTCADCWTTPRAEGKWSPSQVLEHVARSLEASAGDVTGAKTSFPDMPRLLRPVLRRMLFRRVLETGTFQKARTNKAMNPERGPASPSEGIARLESTWSVFASACTDATARGNSVAKSRIFGEVPLADYIRFQGLHTRHHRAQMRGPDVPR
jgi:DinB family protein